MSDLKKRSITALFIGLITIGAVLGGGIYFAAFILFIAFWTNKELFHLFGNRDSDLKGLVFAMITTSPLLVYLCTHFELFELSIQNVLFVIPALVSFIYFLFIGSQTTFQSNLVLSAALSILYVTLGLACAIKIGWSEGTYSETILLSIIILIWTNDSFAYLTGRKVGKTPLAKHISPKKTWEGTFGGAVFTIIGAIILSFIFQKYGLLFWVGLGILVSLFANIGDLLQSSLKRAAGVKDSGNLLPGHGGIFDRYDSFVCVLPIVFIYITLIL